MNIFFDVDSTIVGYWDGSLRPGVREVFGRLIAQGHRLYLWSGVGIRWEVVERHQLGPFITNCYRKPLSVDLGRGEDPDALLRSLGVEVRPDFCVDDYEEIPAAYGGIAVTPYQHATDHDAEMERVYQAILAFARSREAEA